MTETLIFALAPKTLVRYSDKMLAIFKMPQNPPCTFEYFINIYRRVNEDNVSYRVSGFTFSGQTKVDEYNIPDFDKDTALKYVKKVISGFSEHEKEIFHFSDNNPEMSAEQRHGIIIKWLSDIKLKREGEWFESQA